MRCREIQQKLDLYCCEELAPAMRRQIDAHLTTCDTCRRELERIRNLQELLSSDPPPPVPEGFAERIVARARLESRSAQDAIRHTSTGSQWKHRVRVALAASAALAAGFLLGGFLGFDTWSGKAQSVAVEKADPPGESGLQQFVDPDVNSLAQTYMKLTSNNGFERH